MPAWKVGGSRAEAQGEREGAEEVEGEAATEVLLVDNLMSGAHEREGVFLGGGGVLNQKKNQKTH